MRKLLTLLVVPTMLLLTGCPAKKPATDTLDQALRGFQLPAATTENDSPVRLWATYYFLPRVDSVDSGEPLLDSKGDALGPHLSARDWCTAALEGSVVVAHAGRFQVYNFAGTGNKEQVNCREWYARTPAIGKSRWRLARGQFGDGVRDYVLVPFRTVAVDPSVIPYGTVLYIPEARGLEVQLPDGRAVHHDGYFYAADTGGAIKSNHIDVYIGPNDDNPLTFVKNRKGRFDAHIIRHPALSRLFERLHLLEATE